MSDTFDHEQAAWDSLNDYGCEEDGSELHPANVDHLYYHTRLKVIEYKKETDKSFLIKFDFGKEVWVPKKIMKDIKEGSAMFYFPILKKILEESKHG